MDSTTVVAAASAIFAVFLGGIFVYSNHAEQGLILSTKLQEVEDKMKLVESLEKQVSTRESKLEEEKRRLEERRDFLRELEEDLKSKTKEVEERESAVGQTEIALQAKEKDLQQRQEKLEKEADERDDEQTADTELSLDEDDHHETEPEVSADSSSSSTSEAEKRKKMIDEELSKLVKEANENELEDPFDEDSVEALKKAAYKICYLKKYYDVMKDKFIYFPSVTKTVVDYTLIEEAEKHYFEEDDEYPQDLSIGLRSVATMAMAEEDDDMDYDYMLALAQDVAL